jgi:microcystin-dependent protein
MSQPYVGEIMLFGGNFTIRGWAACDGQLLSTGQNQALFSLLGTTFGGDGRTTFALPDMRGRIPMHVGSGPGLTPRKWGARVGSEQVTISASQVGSHGHEFNAETSAATNTEPGGAFVAMPTVNTPIYSETAPGAALAADSVGQTGGGQPHANLMPTQCVTFLIALTGEFPSRN